MTETLSIKVSKQTKIRLKALAKARRIKPSALVREAIEGLLEPGRTKARERPSLYHLTKHILAGAGRGPADLSTHKKHLDDYGQ